MELVLEDENYKKYKEIIIGIDFTGEEDNLNDIKQL